MPFRDLVGHVFGHYRILAPLGAGGMGEVYRAHDTRLQRDVALKILPTASMADPVAKTRLLREARTASQLNHPNICTIHEVGEADGQGFIAMELVEGQSLSARLTRGALGAEDVLRYGLQFAEALAHAHDRCVVHRDFKSANVVLTPEGLAKVLDFGLAKRLPQQDDLTRSHASLSEAGALAGTLAYMPPEQLRGQPADTRSDVWALGVVLYEMAAGARPFDGRTGFELSSAILNQQPRALPGRLPVELRAVIERCLEKEPAQRYQRAGEVRAAIEAIRSSAIVPWEAWRYRLSRRRRLAIAVTATATLALAVALNVELLRTSLFGEPRIASVAVLPLENLSGDAGQDYFSDGMTESLTTDLARFAALKVIPRGSVMRYKGTRKSPAEIARELNVDALITGAVLRADNRVRITAQLIDPKTDEQLLSERYERDLWDVLALQNELTAAIAAKIRLKLTPEEQGRLATSRPVNPEAYDAWLKGRFHWQKLTAKELDIAEGYFRLALEKDPQYAPAYGGIGLVWGVRCNLGIVRCTEALLNWKNAQRKSAELDPTQPGIVAGSSGFYLDWDWSAAAKGLPRLIELSPSDPMPHVWYAEYLLYIAGRLEEGLREMRRALDMDPFNSTHKAWVGQALIAAHQDDEAITYLRQVLEEDANVPLARTLLIQALERKHRYEEALAERRTLAAAMGDRETIEALDRGYGQAAYPGALRANAELVVRRSQHSYIAPTRIAGLYAGASDKERALDWLEKAYEDRDMQMVRITGNPTWDSLRDHPRYRALLRKMNLPEHWQ